jgi:hypothetical protein
LILFWTLYSVLLICLCGSATLLNKCGFINIALAIGFGISQYSSFSDFPGILWHTYFTLQTLEFTYSVKKYHDPSMGITLHLVLTEGELTSLWCRVFPVRNMVCPSLVSVFFMSFRSVLKFSSHSSYTFLVEGPRYFILTIDIESLSPHYTVSFNFV